MLMGGIARGDRMGKACVCGVSSEGREGGYI